MEVLEQLFYNDVTKVTQYTIDFNRHAHRTGWNDQALAHQYYKGLPDRLKDELACIGKPVTLRGLQDLATILDQHYWERQSELSRTSSRSTSSSIMSDNSSTHSATSENPSENGSAPFGYSSNPANNIFSASDKPSSTLSSLLSDLADDDSNSESDYFSAESVEL